MFTDAMGNGRAHSVLVSGSVVYKASQRTWYKYIPTYCQALMSSFAAGSSMVCTAAPKQGSPLLVQHRALLIVINDRQ